MADTSPAPAKTTRRKKSANLLDVAAASGVSRATVSFVLNDTPGQSISEPTRERVRAAALELGYVPNGIARAMREGSSRMVVLNVGEVVEGHYSQSFIRGLGDELSQHGHVLLVRHGPSSAGFDQQVFDTIMPRAVFTLGEWYFVGRELDDGGWETGMASNAALQLQHLHDRGHRDVAMVISDSPATKPLAAVRLKFAREAAKRIGINRPLQLTMPSTTPGAMKALAKFRDAHPAVTAVATIDDELAVRVLRAMYDLRWSAPSDLAVIGFDETTQAAISIPSLTTIHIDGEGHGQLAAREILGLSREGVLPARGWVVERDST